MSIVKVHMLDHNHLGDFYFTNEPAAMATRYLEQGLYGELGPVIVRLNGEAAAEEMFDISNHPRRRSERDRMFGRVRSLSVGDIVEVDGVMFLCRPAEWIQFEPATA